MSAPYHRTQLYIDGQYVDAVKGGSFDVYNPATNQVIAKVANATAEDVNLAVAAAKRALHGDEWGYKSTGAQRAAVLRKFKEVLERRKDEIAELDSWDMGKPLREAQADLGDAITAAEHFAAMAEARDTHQDEIIENGTGGDFTTKIRLEPLGVIAAITPWNYPLLMGIWKVLPALAAGCTVVLKPSELAPLSCLLLGEMLQEAGLPKGVLNVISGLGKDAGAPLAEHDDVDKVSFTGSLPTAQKIMMGAALGPRAVSLELGGKSPLIVFDDAENVDAVVDWILTGILWGSGQVCSATSRVLLQQGIKDKVVSRLLEKIAEVKIGDSLSEAVRTHSGATMGPVVALSQKEKILAFISEAEQQGVSVLYGGSEKQKQIQEQLGEGYFVFPTIFNDVPVTARVWKEEIFGPVLCIRSFATAEEAIAIANDSDFGLAGAVFSADLALCERVTSELRCGIVWQNCCQPAFVQAPWGGVKKSGFGRDLGRWGFEEFTSVKQVTSCAPGYQWGLW